MIISARSITKVHQNGGAHVAVLRDVSVDVHPGELVSIMGPSGSGKSTLLQILGGLDRPTAGTVHFAGIDLGALNDRETAAFRRRRIGFVFQFFHLLPRASVLENVLLPLVLDGRGGAQLETEAAELLASLGLGHRIRHEAHRLSGGEMQRVAIARAIIAKPIAILADEPTGNLDSRTGIGVLETLRALVDERRIACVMVTHDRSAAQYGTRLIALRDGRIERDEGLTRAPLTDETLRAA